MLSAWIAVFNVQVVLAPSFTFTVGSVVMTNAYLAVVLTYMGCAFISFGFIFLNMNLSSTNGNHRTRRERKAGVITYATVASGMHALCFFLLGAVAWI